MTMVEQDLETVRRRKEKLQSESKLETSEQQNELKFLIETEMWLLDILYQQQKLNIK